VDVLRRGPRSWNAWRRQHPTVIPNLTRIFLSVSERQMGAINGGPINLAAARLRRASLRFATLSGANFEGADLSGADLSDTRLDQANLANADLRDAVLDRTDFAGAKLTGTTLSGVNLSKARNLTQAQIAEALGDASTVLPPHLEKPSFWLATAVDLTEPPAETHEPRVPAPVEVRALAKAARVSWLVGGPLQTA
jgi:Pentapeptide repeats (8 copies)